jgi:hypothetical protein
MIQLMYGLARLWAFAMVAKQGCTQAVSPDSTSFGRAPCAVYPCNFASDDKSRRRWLSTDDAASVTYPPTPPPCSGRNAGPCSAPRRRHRRLRLPSSRSVGREAIGAPRLATRHGHLPRSTMPKPFWPGRPMTCRRESREVSQPRSCARCRRIALGFFGILPQGFCRWPCSVIAANNSAP